MGIFKAPKSGSLDSELLVGRLTGVMDLKIFYRGKTKGQDASWKRVLWGQSLASDVCGVGHTSLNQGGSRLIVHVDVTIAFPMRDSVNQLSLA